MTQMRDTERLLREELEQAQSKSARLWEAVDSLLAIVGEVGGYGSAAYKRAERIAALAPADEAKP